MREAEKMTPQNAHGIVAQFVYKATKWNEGAEQYAHELRVHDALDVLFDTVNAKAGGQDDA